MASLYIYLLMFYYMYIHAISNAEYSIFTDLHCSCYGIDYPLSSDRGNGSILTTSAASPHEVNNV